MLVAGEGKGGVGWGEMVGVVGGRDGSFLSKWFGINETGPPVTIIPLLVAIQSNTSVYKLRRESFLIDNVKAQGGQGDGRGRGRRGRGDGRGRGQGDGNGRGQGDGNCRGQADGRGRG